MLLITYASFLDVLYSRENNFLIIIINSCQEIDHIACYTILFKFKDKAFVPYSDLTLRQLGCSNDS